MIEFKRKLSTNGKGYWSTVEKEVTTTHIKCITVFSESNNPWYGELQVYFDTNTWDTDEDGLIYTDRLFESQLKCELEKIGLSGSVYYSEQGMQGDNYVSLDVDAEFCKNYLSMNPTVEVYNV